MRTVLGLIAAATFLLFPALSFVDAGSTDPTAVVRSAAQNFDKATAGYVVRRSETTQHFSAGLFTAGRHRPQDEICTPTALRARILFDLSDGERKCFDDEGAFALHPLQSHGGKVDRIGGARCDQRIPVR